MRCVFCCPHFLRCAPEKKFAATFFDRVFLEAAAQEINFFIEIYVARRLVAELLPKKCAANVIFFLTLIFGETIPSCNCGEIPQNSMSHRKGE